MTINRRKIRISMGSRGSRRSGIKSPKTRRGKVRSRVLLARKIREAKLAHAPAETASVDEATQKWVAFAATQKK